MSNGFVTYDNLFWPGGRRATASDFDGAGGFLDNYGLMFTMANGDVVDLFSNGVRRHYSHPYGGLSASSRHIEYRIGLRRRRRRDGFDVPEPSTWAMMVLGFAGLGFAGYRKARKTVAIAA